MTRDSSRNFTDLNSVLDMLHSGFGIWDLEGTFLLANRCLAKWLDCTPEEAIGRNLIDFVPESEREQVRRSLAEVVAGNPNTRMTTIQRDDGSSFPVLVSPALLSDGNGNSTGIAAIIMDVAQVEDSRLHTADSFIAIQMTLTRMYNELRSMNLTAALPDSQPLPAAHPDFVNLTPREYEVLTHLASGRRVANISEHLGVTPSTIRNHLKSIYRKWNVSSQHELIERVRALRG